MVVYVAEGGFIGQMLTGLIGITGSLFLTLLLILIFLILIALAFRMPILTTGIIYLPLMIVMTSWTGDFIAIFGCTLIYMGLAVAELIWPPGY